MTGKVGLTMGFLMVLNSLLLIKIRNFYSQYSFGGCGGGSGLNRGLLRWTLHFTLIGMIYVMILLISLQRHYLTNLSTE